MNSNREAIIHILGDNDEKVKTISAKLNFHTKNGKAFVDKDELIQRINRSLRLSPTDVDKEISNVKIRSKDSYLGIDEWLSSNTDLGDTSKLTLRVNMTCKLDTATFTKQRANSRPNTRPNCNRPTFTLDNQENSNSSNILSSPTPRSNKPISTDLQTPSKLMRSKTPTNISRSSITVLNGQRTPSTSISILAARQGTPNRVTASAKCPPPSAFMSPPTQQIRRDESPISSKQEQCEDIQLGIISMSELDGTQTNPNKSTSAQKRARAAARKAEAQALIDATWKDRDGAECSPLRGEQTAADEGESSSDDEEEDEEVLESSDEDEDNTVMDWEPIDSSTDLTATNVELVELVAPVAPPESTIQPTYKQVKNGCTPDSFSAVSGGLGDSMRSNASTESSRAKLKPAVPKTPTKPVNSKISRQPLGGSIFPNGKTAAEISSSQASQLRKQDGGSRNTSRAALATKKKAAQNQLAELSPVRTKAAGEGRPSIGTMTTQWEFMRTNFVGNNDEELEWMMVSKNPGAYKHAHRKNVLAEDRYFKSMHDTAKYERQMKHVIGSTARIPFLLAEMAEHAKKVGITNLNPQAGEAIKALRVELKDYLDGSVENPLAAFCTARKGIEDILVLEDTLKLARRTLDAHEKAISDVQSVKSALATAIRDGDQALISMEKWAKRERETDDYAATMREEDDEWLIRERDANLAALSEMWSFVPVNVAEMTVADLMASAADRGGLLSLELATEIKNNRLLHWLVTHVDDIASASFLSGDKKAFYENLETYDLVELRALSVCLPAKFENDNDGKKAEWRSRLIGRAKQLVSQAKGDQVKGVWDEALGRRGMADMAPLKPDQERRALYYYRTKEQSSVRVKQYDEKNALLLKKEGWLKNAESAAAETKTEYDTVLREMRDPDFLEQLTAQQVTQLTSVKDKAKRDSTEAESKRKMLSQEVARLRKTITDAPVSREQFLDMEKDLVRHLKFVADINWSELGLQPVKITGVFDTEPEIVKVERHAAKFSSAEEEAALRKRELTQLQNRDEAPSVPEVSVMSEVTMENISLDASASVACPTTPFRSSSGGNSAVTFSTGVGGGVAAAIRDAESASSGSTETQSEKFQTPRGKRNSVLNANPELLNTLNKMFSPPAGTVVGSSSVKIASRRHSTIATNLFATESAEPVAPKVKVVKQTQSKLLMKLLNNGVSPKKAPDANATAPLSFLDQIKAKKGAAGGGGDGAAPSFLNQLKSRSQGRDNDEQNAPPLAAPMSFLDQIRMKKQKQSTVEVVEEEGSIQQPTIVEEAPVPKKMSFLEMIQSRRKD